MEFYIYIFSDLVLRACATIKVLKKNKDRRKKVDEIAHKYIMLFPHFELDFGVMLLPHSISMRRHSDIAELEKCSTQALKLYFSLSKTLS